MYKRQALLIDAIDRDTRRGTIAAEGKTHTHHLGAYLVTGAAGFIGANFIKYLLHDKYKNEEIKVIVLDALTYARCV